MIAYEAAAGGHPETSTVISTAYTYVGFMSPNYWYSVNYTWNTTGCHNGTTLKLRVQSSGVWYSEDRAVTVNNLSFGTASQDIIKWKDEASQTSETVTVPINGKSLTGVNISVSMNIYDCASPTDDQTNKPVLVRTLTQTIANPATVNFVWDGKDASGTAVKRGLYSFNITATRTMMGPCTDTISYRSETLSVLRGVDSNGQPIYDVEFIGVDDNGTPTDDSDDNLLYVVRTYIAKDLFGATANSTSKIVLYDPDLNTKGEWYVNTLKCRVHNNTMDGCTTSNTGIQHEVIVPVPCGTFDEAGTYRFAIGLIDNGSASCRWHENRYSLVINCPYPPLPIEWVDFGNGWKGAWCRAGYMDTIRKRWCTSDGTDNQRNATSWAYHNEPMKSGNIIATINGGQFVNIDETLLVYPSMMNGALVRHGKVVFKSSAETSPVMNEGELLFDEHGSRFAIKVLDDLSKPSATPKIGGMSLNDILLSDNFTLIEKSAKGYEYGRVCNYILGLGGFPNPPNYVKKAGNDAARSILVIGASRKDQLTGKTGRDFLLLVNNDSIYLSDVRDFVYATPNTIGGLSYKMNNAPYKATNPFVPSDVLMLDGNNSSQVYYTNRTGKGKYDNVYHGPGVLPGVVVSKRYIPDYIRVEAHFK